MHGAVDGRKVIGLERERPVCVEGGAHVWCLSRVRGVVVLRWWFGLAYTALSDGCGGWREGIRGVPPMLTTGVSMGGDVFAS